MARILSTLREAKYLYLAFALVFIPWLLWSQTLGNPAGASNAAAYTMRWLLIYSVLFILLFIIVIRWRTRTLKKRYAELHNRLVEMTQATEELSDVKARLAEAERVAHIGLQTVGIAHELKNPLNFISGGVAALRQTMIDQRHGQTGIDRSQNEELNALLEIIERGVKRCTYIVNGLRAMVDPSKDLESTHVFSIEEVIHESCALLVEKAGAAGVEVVTNVVDARVVGDASMLVQVFVNLIDNAIFVSKSKPGGKVTISTQPATGTIDVLIADNGSGIPAEVQEKILQPFFTTKTSGQGLGLGLFLSHSIVKKHRGQLSFESDHRGTVFTVRLPTS